MSTQGAEGTAVTSEVSVCVCTEMSNRVCVHMLGCFLLWSHNHHCLIHASKKTDDIKRKTVTNSCKGDRTILIWILLDEFYLLRQLNFGRLC